jgi:hypothetical protein
MLAFRMTPAQAEMYFDICIKMQADTETKRLAILQAMFEEGQIQGIVQNKMTQEDYLKHLTEKFGNVLAIKGDN